MLLSDKGTELCMNSMNSIMNSGGHGKHSSQAMEDIQWPHQDSLATGPLSLAPGPLATEFGPIARGVGSSGGTLGPSTKEPGFISSGPTDPSFSKIVEMWVDMEMKDKTKLRLFTGPADLKPNHEKLPSPVSAESPMQNTTARSSPSTIPNSTSSPLVIRDVEVVPPPRKKGGRPLGARNKEPCLRSTDYGKDEVMMVAKESNMIQKKRKTMELISMDYTVLPTVPEHSPCEQINSPIMPLRMADTISDQQALKLALHLLTRPTIATQLVNCGLICPNVLNIIPSTNRNQNNPSPHYLNNTMIPTAPNNYDPNSKTLISTKLEHKLQMEPFDGANQFATMDEFGTMETRTRQMSMNRYDNNPHPSSLLAASTGDIHKQAVRQAKLALQQRQSAMAYSQHAGQGSSSK